MEVDCKRISKAAGLAGDLVRCIWCGWFDPKPAVEHIIPDAFGCPPELVFKKGEVCSGCNNKLSRLDRHLAEQLEMHRLFAGLPAKGGKPPTVASCPNATGWIGPDGPVVHVNMERERRWDSDAQRFLSPPTDDGALITTMQDLGFGFGRVNVRRELRLDNKFARGVFKVGLSLLAFQHGADHARQSQFDHIRRFVRRGEGELKAILLTKDDQPMLRINLSAVCHPTRAVFDLAGLGFYLDLKFGQPELAAMTQEASAAGLTTLVFPFTDDLLPQG